MEIDNIPDVVQRIIFKHLKIGAENKSKTWKMGSFYPSGVYFENEKNKFDETLADKLKFCLIFPHFIENIKFDLNQEWLWRFSYVFYDSWAMNHRKYDMSHRLPMVRI